MPDPRSIVIKGAREHNLKNLDLAIPRDKLVVITGLSGSGKSSLAFDTIYAEGQRRYVESLSAYANRQDVSVGDFTVPLAGVADLITLKRMAGREQDRSDIEALTRLTRLGEEEQT